MPGQLHDTVPAERAARRSDAGVVRLGQRDIDGLILLAEHYAAPYDLLAAALGAQPARLRAITARWRRAGYAATGRLGPGPAWCWLTPAGMTAAGFRYPASRPSLARLAHIRAVLAARLWLSASPAWARARPWWHSERRLRAARPPGPAAGHVPDAEIHWPSTDTSPYPGQVWAVEVELTAKSLGRTTAIMGGLLAGPARYAQVLYLTAAPARPVVTRAADGSRWSAVPDHHPGPAPGRVHPRGGAVMTVWSWLRFTVTLWLLRKAFKLTGWLLLALLALVLWPLTIVTIVSYTAAWLRGWPPARLRRVAAGSLLVPAVYAVVMLARQHDQPSAALAPARAYPAAWHHLATLDAARTFATLAPAAVPAGLLLAAGLWAWRNYAIMAGIGGRMASAPVTFDTRQWNRQAAAAEGRSQSPRLRPAAGPGREDPGRRHHPRHRLQVEARVRVPAAACARHMVIIGASGSGKTNLMMRLWAGWYTAALDAYWAGKGDRPLLIVLDCKGGRDARRKADRTRRLLYGAGARRVALWPDEARVSIWDLPAPDLAVLLYQMVETGTGNAAYYADILYAVTVLAVTAPGRPAVEHRQLPAAPGCGLARIRVGQLPRPGRAGPLRRPAPRRHPAPLRHPARTARHGAGRTRHPGRGRRLVLHPGRHPRTLRRRSAGPGADRTGRPRRHHPGRAAARHLARRR